MKPMANRPEQVGRIIKMILSLMQTLLMSLRSYNGKGINAGRVSINFISIILMIVVDSNLGAKLYVVCSTNIIFDNHDT
jgi:hypothetical protein